MLISYKKILNKVLKDEIFINENPIFADEKLYDEFFDIFHAFMTENDEQISLQNIFKQLEVKFKKTSHVFLNIQNETEIESMSSIFKVIKLVEMIIKVEEYHKLYNENQLTILNEFNQDSIFIKALHLAAFDKVDDFVKEISPLGNLNKIQSFKEQILYTIKEYKQLGGFAYFYEILNSLEYILEEVDNINLEIEENEIFNINKIIGEFLDCTNFIYFILLTWETYQVELESINGETEEIYNLFEDRLAEYEFANTTYQSKKSIK